jgi:transcriptional regulator with XRE-family HTH domain
MVKKPQNSKNSIRKLPLRIEYYSQRQLVKTYKASILSSKANRQKQMANIRDVLAANLKKYRRRNDFSQDKLAELADISAQYLATVETRRKFPTPEVLDRLAAALGIESHLLFEVSATPVEALERLHRSVVADIKQVVREAIKETLAEECKAKGKG